MGIRTFTFPHAAHADFSDPRVNDGRQCHDGKLGLGATGGSGTAGVQTGWEVHLKQRTKTISKGCSQSITKGPRSRKVIWLPHIFVKVGLNVITDVICARGEWECVPLTSSTVGTLLPAALKAFHRAESAVHARLSNTCSSIRFRCLTMSRDRPSSERMNTSITCACTSAKL